MTRAEDWPWGSYPGYHRAGAALEWVCYHRVLGEFGRNEWESRRQYRLGRFLGFMGSILLGTPYGLGQTSVTGLAIDDATALFIDAQGAGTVYSIRDSNPDLSPGHVYFALAGATVGGTTVCLDQGEDVGQKVLTMSNVYMRWYSNGDSFNITGALVPDYTINSYAILGLEEVLDQQGNSIGSKVVVTGGNELPLPPLSA